MHSEKSVNPNETLECTTQMCYNTFTIADTTGYTGICPECGYKHDRFESEQDGSEPIRISDLQIGRGQEQKSSVEYVGKVTLEVDGYQFTKRFEQPIGKEVRRGVLKAGRDKEVARQVHREHIQFVVVDGGPAIEVLGTLGISMRNSKYSKGEVTPRIKQREKIILSQKPDIIATVVGYD